MCQNRSKNVQYQSHNVQKQSKNIQYQPENASLEISKKCHIISLTGFTFKITLLVSKPTRHEVLQPFTAQGLYPPIKAKFHVTFVRNSLIILQNKAIFCR